MNNFKIWIMGITIYIWKRKIRKLNKQVRHAEVSLQHCKGMLRQIEEEANNE